MNCLQIGYRQLDNLIYSPKVVIIDLRDYVQYREGHINRAINIPAKDMEDIINNNISKRHNEVVITLGSHVYDAKTLFILYCDRGSRSLDICTRLSEHGIFVYSLAGGYRAYKGKNKVNGNERYIR